MSYLNVPRLHFSGEFQADVSTINNDPKHFNNASFQPQYEQPRSLTDENGWWNPRGSGAFRLVGCRVQMVRYLDGTVCTDVKRDPVIGMSVSDGGGRVAAKMVDLDSEQQWVSEIWGLIVRLLDGAGAPKVEGKYKVASFFDIWRRAQEKTVGDQVLAAAYQSVLSDLRWQDDAGSRFLNELREAARESGELSIKWNLDGFSMARICTSCSRAPSS